MTEERIKELEKKLKEEFGKERQGDQKKGGGNTETEGPGQPKTKTGRQRHEQRLQQGRQTTRGSRDRRREDRDNSMDRRREDRDNSMDKWREDRDRWRKDRDRRDYYRRRREDNFDWDRRCDDTVLGRLAMLEEIQRKEMEKRRQIEEIRERRRMEEGEREKMEMSKMMEEMIRRLS